MKTTDTRTSSEHDFATFLRSRDYFQVRAEGFVVDARTRAARDYADDTERWRYRGDLAEEASSAEAVDAGPTQIRYSFTPEQMAIAAEVLERAAAHRLVLKQAAARRTELAQEAA